MNSDQLRKYVIKPAIEDMGVYSPEAEELLLFTACAESNCGEYIHQVKGPAVGIFQMEPFTHDDCWKNYLEYRPVFEGALLDMSLDATAEEMAWNLKYAAAMARVKYLRIPDAIPPAWHIKELAEYYKEFYNTPLGSATVEGAIAKYHKYTDPF